MNDAQIITIVLYIVLVVYVTKKVDNTGVHDLGDFLMLLAGSLLMAAWTAPILYLPIFILLGNL